MPRPAPRSMLPAALAACGLGVLALLLLAAPATAQWLDATAEAGLQFRLAGEVHGDDDTWPGFPEIIGGGACWADFDGDGYDDLYLVNQVYNAENPGVDPAWAAGADPHSMLYLNDGDGTLTDASAAGGADSRGFGYGCSAADYDGDMDVDLFVAHFGDAMLFRNRGDATFDNVSAASGVDMPGACGEFACMSTSSAWADYDLDGDLDLFVGNYVDTTLHDDFRSPGLHNAQLNFLHRNNADGTFSEVATQAGVQGRNTDAEGSKTFGVVWVDYDLDGDPDLYVCNDTEPNEVYQNRGDGTFEDRSAASLANDPRSSMGCASGDYDGDGLPDLYMTHYEFENNAFYRNNGDGTFEDRSGEDELSDDEPYVGWGTSFVDVDRDGDLDLFVVNGHTEWDDPDYEQGGLVFRQDPPLPGADPWDRQWVNAEMMVGAAVQHPRVGRGAAFADYDLDGDTDVVVVNNANQTAELLRADTQPSWLTVQLRQPGANRFAVGARVKVEAGGNVSWREVGSAGGYLSQSTLNLEFGMAGAAAADRITVRWPGGAQTVLQDVAAQQVVRVDQATGTYETDTLSPLTRAVLSGPEGEQGWWRGPVEAILDPVDRGIGSQSGVVATEFSADGSPWQPWAGAAVGFAGEGTHTLRMRSRDAVGNQEPPRLVTIGIDSAPPEVPTPSLEGERGLEGWFVSPSVRVTLTATDALSGVASFRHRVDGGGWQDVRGPFDVTGDGIHQVEAAAVDKAGNAGAVAAFEVRIDATAPQVVLDHPREGGVYLGDEEVAVLPVPHAVVVPPPLDEAPRLALRALARDGTSGVDRVVFRVDGRVVGVDRAAPFEAGWDLLAAGAGLHEVEALAFDHAGNLAGHEVPTVVAGAAVLPGVDGSFRPDLGPALPLLQRSLGTVYDAVETAAREAVRASNIARAMLLPQSCGGPAGADAPGTDCIALYDANGVDCQDAALGAWDCTFWFEVHAASSRWTGGGSYDARTGGFCQDARRHAWDPLGGVAPLWSDLACSRTVRIPKNACYLALVTSEVEAQGEAPPAPLSSWSLAGACNQ